MTNILALPSGTELVGDFRIERVLGAGGFGMTYLADEIALARLVTIKEYFPTDCAARGEGLAAVPRDGESSADFQWGLDRFIDEAQTLARFDHPNIVRVYRYFKANGTAYMVLTFEEGQSLKAWLKSLGRAPRQREIDDVLKPLLDALEVIHTADFLHRDIAPDNIIIRKDGSPVLIDFGSARGDVAKHSRTFSALVKPGYSPYEQYAESGARQGPWTDIYALGATLYHAIGGKRPSDAPSRVVKDELAPAREAALAAYRHRFLAAIDKALELDPERRPQSVAAWRGDLLAPDPSKPGWIRRAAGLAAEMDDAAPVKTKVLTKPPGVVPPPPDVPGAPGQMLDYIEGLKQGPGVFRPGTEPPKRVAESGKASGERGNSLESPRGKQAAVSEKLPVPVPAARKPKPARPRPVRLGSARQWRSFAVKFVIGAGIAGAAISFKDRLPGLQNDAAGGGSSYSLVRVVTPAPRITVLSGHRGGATALAFYQQGRSIVTAGADGTLKIWDTATGASIRTIPLGEGPATALAVSGNRAATGHAGGRIVVWDLDNGARISSLKQGEAGITAVGFGRDVGELLAASNDSTLTVWDARAPQTPLGHVEAHDGSVTAAAYSPRGPYIATGGDDRAVRLWRAGDLGLVRTYRGHREPISAVSFSPDGRHVAAAALDGRIRVWSTSSSSLYRLNSAQRGPISGLAFSPAGDLIASAAADGSVQLWLFRHGRSVRALAEHGAAAKALAFAPDGSRAAVASADGSVRFWDAAPTAFRR